MNRVFREEKKYLIGMAEALQRSHLLGQVMREDPHNGVHGYRIRSLYFDTAYDSALYDKINGTANRDKYRMDDVALICQSFNLFPLLTVLENVMYPMTLRGISAHKAKETAKEKLAAVGLDETYYKRLPDMLSGGEQQRVSIARALAKNPKLLLCDEPTGALDYNTGKAILKLLQDMCRERGMTVILITHNSAITPMADRVIKMKNGKVGSMKLNERPVPIETIEW